MIDIKMSQEKLIQVIKSSSGECVQLKQVYTRLADLIGSKLDTIISDLTDSSLEDSRSRSKIIRRALVHGDYIELLERYLESSGNYIQSKVTYDTHMMLFEARRSINSYQRELVNTGRSIRAR